MKADQYGTFTEQKRARMGWINNSERKRLVSERVLKPGHIAGEKCGCCAHREHKGESIKCAKGDFATRVNSYCKEFEAK